MSHAFFEALALCGVTVIVRIETASSTRSLLIMSAGGEEVVVETLNRDHSYARVLHQLVIE